MPILLGFLPIVMLDIVFRENLFVLDSLSSAHRAPCLAELAGADWDCMPNGHIARSDAPISFFVAFRHVAILAIMFGAKLGHARQHGG